MDDEMSYHFSSKWSQNITAHGFTQVPNLLLSCQKHLGITDGELATYLLLLKYRFSSRSKVYPSIALLSAQSGSGYSTIQRRLKQLEEKGFLMRLRRQGTSNLFDLTPGARILTAHSVACPISYQNRSEGLLKTERAVSPKMRNKEDEGLIIPMQERMSDDSEIDTLSFTSIENFDEHEYHISETGPDNDEKTEYYNAGYQNGRNWRI